MCSERTGAGDLQYLTITHYMLGEHLIVILKQSFQRDSQRTVYYDTIVFVCEGIQCKGYSREENFKRIGHSSMTTLGVEQLCL